MITRGFSETFVDIVFAEDAFTIEALAEFEGEARAAHEPLVGTTLVESTQTGEWRWGDCRRLVFRLPSGEAWATDFRTSSGDEGEAHWDTTKEGVVCYRVEPVEVTVTKWQALGGGK